MDSAPQADAAPTAEQLHAAVLESAARAVAQALELRALEVAVAQLARAKGA